MRRAWRWLALAVGTAAVAGVIMGVEITLDDPVWPERGGVEGLLQACLIFFAWSLPPSALTAATLFLLIRRIGAGGPAITLLTLAGAAVQAGALWVEALLAGAGPFPWRDLAPSAAVGAMAGVLSPMAGRPRSRKAAHG